jgi:hypothetical protein
VSPYISAAGQLTGTGAGTGAGSIASYMSPYQSQVIDATLAEFDRQAAARQQAISDQAVALRWLWWWQRRCTTRRIPNTIR